MPCAIEVSWKDGDGDDQGLTQPEISRREQVVIVAVDIGHYPSRANCIVDNLEKVNLADDRMSARNSP